MSERSEVQCQNAFVRAELSGLLFRDKASQPCYALMSINWANGNMGKTAIFKRLTHLPRVRMFEDYIKELNFIYEANELSLTFLREVRARN